MSARRLAEDSVQPASFAFSNDNLAWAERKIAQYPAGPAAVGGDPAAVARAGAGRLDHPADDRARRRRCSGMAYIRVLEVATFYTMFLLKPVGTRAHIQVCGTTPCMLRGAEELREVCQHKINHEPFETNPDGTMSWEEVECLGACVNAPMVMIGKDTYEDLTVERFEEIVDAFAAGKGDTIKPGTQIDRIFSAPEGGPVTLLERHQRPTSTAHRSPASSGAPAAAAGADERRPRRARAPTRRHRRSRDRRRRGEGFDGEGRSRPGRVQRAGRGRHAQQGDASRCDGCGVARGQDRWRQGDRARRRERQPAMAPALPERRRRRRAQVRRRRATSDLKPTAEKAPRKPRKKKGE